MLLAPSPNDFAWSLRNTTARPGGKYGTVVTPAASVNIVDGAWAQLFSGAAVTEDVFFISICLNDGATPSAIRRIIADIGVDRSGGTSYSILIPELFAGYASAITVSGGIWYNFPLYIPAGSSLAIRACSDIATTFGAYVTLFGKPRSPELCKYGNAICHHGNNVLNGTAITLGTTSKGAWVNLGTPTVQNPWWWQLGYTCQDASMSAAAIFFDVAVGDATTKNIVITNAVVNTTANEQISIPPITFQCTGKHGWASGDSIYIRGQSSTVADTSPTVKVWSLGGG